VNHLPIRRRRHHGLMAEWGTRTENIMIKIYLIPLLVCLFLIGCKKWNDPDFFVTQEDLKPLYTLPDSSSCIANKKVPGLGKIEWRANTLVTLDNGNLLITFITFQDSTDFSIRERLSFWKIPLSKGEHELANDTQMPFSNYSRWLADGDVLNASWELNTSKNNCIVIKEINASKRTVKGTFDVHFIMDTQGIPGHLHSERIDFADGEFEIVY
jgi:hypothetical protein